MAEGNLIAAMALLSWPFVALVLFRALPMSRAFLANVLIAYLFLPPLPAGFDFPVLPPLNKESIPNIMLIILALALAKERIEWFPRNRVARALIAVFVLSPVMTVFFNQEPVFYGRVGLPGLRFREAFAISIQQFLFIVPFLLARHFLAHEKDQRDVVLAIAVAGLVYSIPTLVEVRLSPQLNLWIYGWYQHSFIQSVRFGGFRPLVFLYHGIWLAFFIMTAVVCAVSLLRNEAKDDKLKWGFIFAYLAAVLILCKSAGAAVFALGLVPLVLFTPKRVQLHFALGLSIFAVAYPVIKASGILPIEELLAWIRSMSEERAGSLGFRFLNEDVLLERAYIKPLFGWGSWGRNHILDGFTGNILTVTDGRWIIVIGTFGWVGFLAEFGLLTLPIALLWLKTREGHAEYVSPYAVTLAVLLAINVVDLIPNATITSLTWLFAGAVLGYAERYRAAYTLRETVFRTVI